MAASQRKAIVFTNLTGRDRSTTDELAIPKTRAKEMVNVDLYRTIFARKRNGCQSVFPETTGELTTGILSSLLRFVPAGGEESQELWKVDDALNVQRLAGGLAWTTPTLKDAIASHPQDVIGISFNGKFFLFYDSAVDRSHVWDGATVRRTGLAAPAAPTVADQGGGATYPAVLRHYLVRDIAMSGSTIVRRSEATASVSFTPSGGGDAARVTKGASAGEGETHWELYGSDDGNLFFLIATTPIGTTFYDDSADPHQYSGGNANPLVGANIPPVSAKYGLVDGNRLLIAGSWESTSFTSRVWFTPRLGSSDAGDDERIPDTVDQENFVDFDEKDGSEITALGGPFEGMPIVFKYRHIWAMRPTGSPEAPYRPMIISKLVGAVRQQLVVMAEDQHGNPAIYFWSHVGPYRFGLGGLQFCGDDILDLVERHNLDASNSGFVFAHTDLNQLWFYLALDGEDHPRSQVAVFDYTKGFPDENNRIRGGWTIFEDRIADARCGVMFSRTLGASMSRVLAPYLGSNDVATLLRGDAGELDVDEPYSAFVTLPEQHLAGANAQCTVDGAILLGSAGPHYLMVQMHRDYGCERRDSEVNMAPETGDQTRSQKAVEATFHADAKSIGAKVGDICPVSHPWNLDAFVIQYEVRQDITG